MADLAYLQAVQNGLAEPNQSMMGMPSAEPIPPPHPIPEPNPFDPNKPMGAPGFNPPPEPPPPPQVAPSPAPTAASIPMAGDSGLQAFVPEIRKIGGGGVTPAHEAAVRGPVEQGLRADATDAQLMASETALGKREVQSQHEAGSWDQERVRREGVAKQVQAASAVRAKEERDLADKYAQTVDSTSRGIQQDQSSAASAGMAFVGMLMSMMPGNLGRAGQMAMQYVDKQIERDLEVKKFNYKAGLDRRDGAQKSYDNLVKIHGSEEAADTAYRAAMNDAWAAKMGGMNVEHQGTEIGAKTAELQGDLMNKKLMNQADGIKYVQAAKAPEMYSIKGSNIPRTHAEAIAAENKSIETGSKTQEMVLGKNLDLRNDLMKEGGKERGSKEVPEMKLPDGTILKKYDADTPADAAEGKASRARAVEILNSIDAINGNIKEGEKGPVGKTPVPWKRQWEEDAKTNAATLKANASKYFGQNYRGDAAKLVDELVGDPTAMRNMSSGKMDRLRAMVLKEESIKQQSKGGGLAASAASASKNEKAETQEEADFLGK